MKRELDAQAVRELLDELAKRLRERGVRGSIRVAGGAAMLLRFPNDPDVRVTRDIDALIQPSDEVKEVVAEMATDLSLPSTWLNDAGKGWLRVHAEHSSEQVAISIATPRELIAMKLSAARDKDLVDLGILAKHLGITDPADLVRIAYEIYGEDAVELPDGPKSYLWYAESVIEEAYRPKKRRRS